MTNRALSDFDSDSPQEETSEQKFDYAQVFAALEHSLEVAETAFCRCAKRQFRDLVGYGQRMMTPDDGVIKLPVWYTWSSVTLDFANHWDETGIDARNEDYASMLKDIVELAASNVQAIRKNKDEVFLVGPLITKVVEVGAAQYSFSIKQRWSLSE